MILQKIAVTCICLSVLVTAAHAQTKDKVNIKEATIFLNGAELLSTTKIELKAGETEFIFSNIAGNINQKSLVYCPDVIDR